MKKWLKNIAVLFFGLFLAFGIFEIFLRFYNPFKSRVSGDEIELPANQKYEFHNQKIAGLDSHIVHSKNSMGFRGTELPENAQIPRIFFVGGSTTECFYLSDGEDWPSRVQQMLGLGFWVNNAGLDGHSSRGHSILLKDHLIKYKPKMVFFLVGCNDVAAEDLNTYESGLLKKKKRFLQHFETYNLLLNLRLAAKARKRGMGHNPVDFKNHERTDTAGWREEKANPNLLNAYGERIQRLIFDCKQNGIKPVFITQPTLLSGNTEQGIFHGDYLFQGKSGMHYAKILDQYNEVTKRACIIMHAELIDLANALKPETVNYYDFFHFTRIGSERVAEIIFNEIKKRKLIDGN